MDPTKYASVKDSFFFFLVFFFFYSLTSPCPSPFAHSFPRAPPKNLRLPIADSTYLYLCLVVEKMKRNNEFTTCSIFSCWENERNCEEKTLKWRGKGEMAEAKTVCTCQRGMRVTTTISMRRYSTIGLEGVGKGDEGKGTREKGKMKKKNGVAHVTQFRSISLYLYQPSNINC